MRVMQSFGAPRATSNPYVHMLDDALSGIPGVEHLRFSRRRALVGRYDVLHVHWPETLLGGRTRPRRVARRVYLSALVTRLRLSRIAVVRTVHNLELPDVDSAWERALLREIECRADLQIFLNAQTPIRPAVPTVVIAHGHYRDWYAAAPRAERAPRALAFVGLIRRYKGVEHLVEAFAATRATLPDWSLRISGNPTGTDLADALADAAASDARVGMDLRYLSEADFARAVTASAGVVLPYRFMHNSGTALAVLSLARPVLVPRTEVNTALAAEVGAGWVHQYDDDLDPDDLRDFARAIEDGPPSEPPRLDARDWTDVGARHREAYARAVRHRRGTAR